MNKVRKFKLIKIYPGSPELGSMVIDTKPNNEAKDGYFSENWGGKGPVFKIGKYHNCENNPDYWEEVVEKDFEILTLKKVYDGNLNIISYEDGDIVGDVYGKSSFSSYKNKEDFLKSFLGSNTNWNINSIRRNSDGEIFTIGDRIKGYNSDSNPFIITGFTKTLLESSFLILGQCRSTYVKSAIKYKEPFYITEDGVEIQEGDKTHWICYDTSYKYLYESRTFAGHLTLLSAKDNGKNIYKVFSTEESARLFVLKNKEVLSFADIAPIIGEVNDGRRIDLDKLTEKLLKLVKSKTNK